MKVNLFWKKLREYFSVYLPRQRNSSTKTITTSRMAWNLFLRFLLKDKKISPSDLTFETFTANLLSEFLDEMERQKQWKNSTRNNRLSCIRSFFRFATHTCPDVYMVYKELCTIPLKKGIDHSRVVNHMSKAAISSIIESIDVTKPKGLRDKLYLTMMYDTAARNGEILALKISDINVENATVCLLGKGAKPRLVPLSNETIVMFAEYKTYFHKIEDAKAPLFYTIHRGLKTPMSDDNVARFLKKYAYEARKKNEHVPENVHPHMLRHSRAMHLYQNGMPLAILSEFLGHEDPETTLIYAYADTEMKREAVEKASKNLMFLFPEKVDANLLTWDEPDIIKQLLRGY